ncbi:MAG: tRNA lysidine(34) synthetase TilS [Gammaproteobacteria bacterium]|nr:tRNA lysidine(34) synthetase TilS [Gammaproteobacteria bacterium]
MAFDPERLAAALLALEPGWRSSGFCVALSGGLDSSVLLHALASLRADNPGLNVRAVHVNHGLQSEAAAWVRACEALCRSSELELQVLHLELKPAPGESIEAEARNARYEAIAGILNPGEWLLTAHHRDDQMETVLIQLMRGAGVAGLAAMPGRARLGAGLHGRPLLEFDRAELAAYAELNGLSWVSDPTNSAARFDRGWLREQLLPRLHERWPQAAATVSRSARHLAEAGRLLAALAESDASCLLDKGRLAVDGLRRLSRDRQVNLLRWWIREQGLGSPSAARFETIMLDLMEARADAEPVVRWESGELRRYRDRLYAMHPLVEPPAVPLRFDPRAPGGIELGSGLGRIVLVAGDQGGLDPASLQDIVIRFRAGGESLRPHPARPRKRLKQLCQEAGIVPWMRERLPLLFIGSRLVAVGDLWFDADLAVAPGTSALKPVWHGRPDLY